jgi:uncharacterized SAM-binding protein YcdF (DUF218 family)
MPPEALSSNVSTVSHGQNAATTSLREPPRPVPWWPALCLAAAMALMLCGLAYGLHGKPLAEKMLTALVMPVGALWLIISGRIVSLIARGRTVGLWPSVLLWTGLMICGTRPLPGWLAKSIESSVSAHDWSSDGPLDAVVVLGGGTSFANGRAQAAGAGDRVLLAAQLYHQGLVQRLITTGEVTPGLTESSPDPGEQTIEIWTRLGVPRTAILKCGGRNTYEELQSIERSFPELRGRRVGLLTSARHLPRAMRLAHSAGVTMIPVAADVRWSDQDWHLLNFIPQAGAFCDLAASQHELMARIVSR